jgi:hypothetical protein
MGNSHNDWGDRWHIPDVTARYSKGLCLICHSWQILADFTTTRLLSDGRDMPMVAHSIARIANTH